jgi:SAM-dependent methyltransferase
MIGGYYIERMKSLGLLSRKGFALDIGCHSGYDSKLLKDMGYTVEAVDKKDFPPVPGIPFTKADIIDFPIETAKYSLILCNNTLPFIKDKKDVANVIAKISEGLVPGGIAHFTLFGHNDDWADNLDWSFYDYDEAKQIVHALPWDIVEQSNFEGEGMTMKGEPKHFEIHRFTCKKNA